MGYRLPLSVQVILLYEIKKKTLVKKSVIPTQLEIKGVVAFNATFNDISVILWGGQFYWWRKVEYPEKTTDLSQVI